MLIALLLLVFSFDSVRAVSGFYSYQVAEIGTDLELYCLSSGVDIKWSRVINKVKEQLNAPDYEISKSYRCGNPHLCGGYDVVDTQVCRRSTITIRNVQRGDSGTYYCQEGVQEGAYSFAYVVNVLETVSPPHIYDFSPLQCNGTDWYGCIATGKVARYEYLFAEVGTRQKTLLIGTRNKTVLSGKEVQFVVRGEYITLSDFSVLQDPSVQFGCRVYSENGGFNEYLTGKTFNGYEDVDSRGSYESYIMKMIGIGVGALVLLIIIAVLACKLRKRCKKSDQRRISETNSHIQYSGLNRTENKL